jgi:hypothetical protein
MFQPKMATLMFKIQLYKETADFASIIIIVIIIIIDINLLSAAQE